MQQNNINPQSGVSLVELLIVITVAVILTTFALASFDRAKSQLQRQNIAREFKTYLERARFDSVKRRATAAEPNNGEARITINNATSFSVALDFNQDGLLNAANETRTINFAGSSGGQFANVAAGTIVSYNRLGQVTAVNAAGTSVTPTFTFCSENCGSANFTPTAKNATIITISSSGTVMLTPGGSSISNPSNPTLNNVNGNTDVNDLTKILLTNSNSNSH